MKEYLLCMAEVIILKYGLLQLHQFFKVGEGFF